MASTSCARNTFARTWSSGWRHPSPSADGSAEQKLQSYHHNRRHSYRQFVLHVLPCAQRKRGRMWLRTGLGQLESKITSVQVFSRLGVTMARRMVSGPAVRGMEKQWRDALPQRRRRWSGRPASTMCPVDGTCKAWCRWGGEDTKVGRKSAIQGGSDHSASALLKRFWAFWHWAQPCGDVSGGCRGEA
jgi:hypothetical protein